MMRSLQSLLYPLVHFILTMILRNVRYYLQFDSFFFFTKYNLPKKQCLKMKQRSIIYQKAKTINEIKNRTLPVPRRPIHPPINSHPSLPPRSNHYSNTCDDPAFLQGFTIYVPKLLEFGSACCFLKNKIILYMFFGVCIFFNSTLNS